MSPVNVNPASFNMTEPQLSTSQDVQPYNIGIVDHSGSDGIPTEHRPEVKNIPWTPFSTLEAGTCGWYRPRLPAVAYGGFSDVYLCDARLSTTTQVVQVQVAVKKLRSSPGGGNPDGGKAFHKLAKYLMKELNVWKALQHSNIAPLLGYTSSLEMCLISPWFANGNLANFIEAKPSVNRTNLTKGIAEGLAYLHCRDPTIVHGDIKPDNVLIDESDIPVLIDFGLSRILESDPELACYSPSSLRGAGNDRWIAPELFSQDGVSRSCSSDVYSFGCLAFFTFTGDKPFKELAERRLAVARCLEKAQPIGPGVTYPVLDAEFGIMKILSACWMEEPLERPTMLSITQQPPLSQHQPSQNFLRTDPARGNPVPPAGATGGIFHERSQSWSAGGAGASYGGPSFLSFADLIGTNASSHNEAQSSASSRKGKPRQAKHAPVESAVEGSSDDGFGEEELPEGDPGPDEGASSFSRHPPGYPQPNYDPPQYRPRYPYEMGSPPQQPLYHAHAPHPYAQSDLRTRSYEYDNERDMRVDDSLRKVERDREWYRPQVPNGNLPRHPYEPNVGYPLTSPGHHFIYGPGVGAASAGRALAGYTQLGHAGYRGPSPSNSLNSIFASGPPPPKADPFYSGPRLAMVDARHGAAALPGPPLSMSIGRSGGASPTSDQYLQTMEHSTNSTTYNESGYRSPNPPPNRSPMGAGMTSSRTSMSHISGEIAEEAADVDVEPMPNPHQLSAGTSASTQVDITTAYTSNPFIPNDSSFGPSYSFDKTFQDAELDGNSTGALVSASSNPSVGNSLPLGPHAFTSMMAMLGIETLADAPGAIETHANTSDLTLLAALQLVQVAIALPPPIDSQPMYIATFGSQHLQFTARQMELLHLYKNDLCNLQYHIAHSTDSSIADELFDLAMNSEVALFGTLTLTSLYKIRLRGGGPTGSQSEEMIEVHGFLERVSTALAQKKEQSMLDSGDAMAALHMVSAVLFEGGTSAEWDQYLDIAQAYVAQHPVVKMGSWNSSPTLEGTPGGRLSGAMTTTVDKKTQFIIKTVAWFDVIGSVTMRRKPLFLDTYRELFGRQGGAAMERIMGCNEKVLLAIAETAALAAWRREEENKGTLNIMNLAQKGGKIDEILSFTGPQYNGSGFDDYLGGMSEAQMEQERQARIVRLVSNVFRAAGMLYLHTVVRGCNPDLQDIKTAVQATVDAFKVLEASDFDRSLVFPITLAGCMTDNKEHRAYLEGRLLKLGFKGQAVGNSSSCLKLMNRVWKKRDQQLMGSRMVDWIDTMHELGWSLLLV